MEKCQIDLTKYLENTALIHHKPGTTDIIKYKDLLKQVLKVGLVIENEELSKTESITIGILIHKSPSAIAVALAIMEADFAFCFISKDDIPHELDKLGIKYFFSDELLQTSNLVTLRNSKLDVFGLKIRLFKQLTNNSPVRSFNDSGDALNRICYTITTSGTTGQKKIVRVTFNCITPNVVGLQKIFRLNKDVIYSSAPCTFDVFVLDLFLALHSGSALMILDESLRYSEESLNLMFAQSTGVTFLQVTPSLFQQYGLENIQKILNARSSLKFLVLGGEQFPSTREVMQWQNWSEPSTKRIFNIYGITEMSCWSMLHEVTKEDLDAGEVPLGQLLENTNIAFLPDLSPFLGLEEVLLISKTRICFVDDKEGDKNLGDDLFFAQHTGDLVRRCSDGKIFFYGRKNDIIKRFGERVNLGKVEAIASELIASVSCVYIKKKIVLFVKTEDDQIIEDLKKILHAKLKSSEVPDDVRKITFFPLSENGKICKQRLKEIYKDFWREDREKRIEAEESFLEAINSILNMRLGKPASSDEPDGKRLKTEIDLTFRSLGGSSFDALRISMRLEDQIGFSNGLLPKLLGNQHSIRDICHYLKDLKGNTHSTFQLPRAKSNCATKIMKRYDLKKCIDASPALLKLGDNALISVGSHSHEIITIDAENLQIVSTTILGGRIESEVSLMEQNGVVGCYDGHLYCFDLQTGALTWKFNSNGMIKSKALIIDDLIIFGNYNYEKNLWCLQRKVEGNVELKWNSLVGSRGILAAPLLLRNSTVLVCTLDGTIELVKAVDGSSIWSRKLESPIFSSPQQIPGRIEIEVLVAEVSKKIHCFDIDGAFKWKLEVDGHMFSSFTFRPGTDPKIIFGCHDKKLRCYNYHQNTPNLEWSVELQSQIYGTPKITTINSEDYIVSCVTSGYINFVKLSNGALEHSLRLAGEIFSTPLIIGKMIFVGCRDNFLYCINF